MPSRIDNFVGDDAAYTRYLIQTIIKYYDELSPTECIRQLELQVKVQRSQPQTASSLCVEFWSPNQPPPTTSTVPNWRKETATFFQDLPRTEDDWDTKRKDVCLSNGDDILCVVDQLASGRISENSNFKDHTTEQLLEDALLVFGQNVGSNLAFSKTRAVSHFLSLIFLAACQVAIYEGHPKPSVDNAQRKFLEASCPGGKCKKGPQTLANDRAAVLWLIYEMERQVRRGLQHRAFELFLLAGNPISFYKACPKDPVENEKFTTQIPCSDVPAEIQAALPFWIPFFVATNFSQWDYSTVCKALGVSILNQEKDFQHFRETHLSRKIGLCRVEVLIGKIPDPQKPRKRRNHAPKKPRTNGATGTQYCIQLQGPSHSNVEADSPENNRSAQSPSETVPEQVASPNELGTRFRPANPGANMPALRPNNETTQPQSRPEDISNKRPRHGGNSAGQNRLSDLDSGDRLHKTPSPSVSQPQTTHTLNNADLGAFVGTGDEVGRSNPQVTWSARQQVRGEPITSGQHGPPFHSLATAGQIQNWDQYNISGQRESTLSDIQTRGGAASAETSTEGRHADLQGATRVTGANPEHSSTIGLIPVIRFTAVNQKFSEQPDTSSYVTSRNGGQSGQNATARSPPSPVQSASRLHMLAAVASADNPITTEQSFSLAPCSPLRTVGSGTSHGMSAQIECPLCDLSCDINRLKEHVQSRHAKRAFRCPYDKCSTIVLAEYFTTHWENQHGLY